MLPKILVIVGPTASGKSDLAVQLAKKYNGEIISADSRQVYKGLDIGTGKITKKEMKGVPHHLIDVANPQLRQSSAGQAKEQFSVSDYKKLAEKAIEKILKKGKLPIICGGTGLYIDTLLGDIFIPEVPPNPLLRKKLEKKSVSELFKMLQKLDPTRAKNIDAKNPRRLIRAIEIAKKIDSVPPLSEKNKTNKKYDAIKIGIKLEPEELKKRINKRIEKWFKQGLLREVQNLHKKGLSWKRMSEIGLEYKLVSEYLQNRLDKKQLIERMQIETYQYAKRQKTWFKRDKEIIWISPSQLASSLSHALNFLRS